MVIENERARASHLAYDRLEFINTHISLWHLTFTMYL